jgi:hypothetical protein
MSFNNILVYTELLFGKIFSIWGIVTTISSFALFFFGNGILPATFPAFFLGTILLLLMLIICGSLVWLDQLKLTVAVKRELADIKENMPIFSLSEIKATKYSIQPIIEYYQQMLVELEPKEVQVQPIQDVEESVRIGNPVNFFNADLLAGVSAIKKMTEVFTSQLRTSAVHTMFSVESREDKYERIKNHIIQLERYQQNLDTTYKIDLSFMSSRAASNIEISLISDNSSSLVLSVDFIKGNIPHTAEPQQDRSFMSIVNHYPEINRHIYSSYMKAERAFAGLTRFMNAGLPEGMFDQNLYVINKNKSLDLEIEFISKELIKPQTIRRTLDLSNVNTILIRE